VYSVAEGDSVKEGMEIKKANARAEVKTRRNKGPLNKICVHQ
jgi:hypothetical protein